MRKPLGSLPPHFQFSTTQIFIEQHPELIRNFFPPPEGDVSCNDLVADFNYEVRRLPSNHPLHGERGVFATAPISTGTYLGEYVGEVKLISSSWPMHAPEFDYAFALPLGPFFYVVDAKKWGSEMAFVNDYRGLSPSPNIESTWLIDADGLHLLYRTRRAIAKDEELFIDYGDDYWKAPHRKVR
jgi:SET domain-containing protein